MGSIDSIRPSHLCAYTDHSELYLTGEHHVWQRMVVHTASACESRQSWEEPYEKKARSECPCATWSNRSVRPAFNVPSCRLAEVQHKSNTQLI
jgi:hypothetical protein